MKDDYRYLALYKVHTFLSVPLAIISIIENALVTEIIMHSKADIFQSGATMSSTRKTDQIDTMIAETIAVNSTYGFRCTTEEKFAIEKGIETLLKNKVNPNQAKYGITPLMFAVGQGSREMTQLLLEYKANPNQAFGLRNTMPLLGAVSLNDTTIVELLLEYKADPNQPSGLRNAMPLVVAAMGPNATAIVELLLKYKADPNPKADTLTPLLGAVSLNNTAIVELLLKYKADPNHRTGDLTPLSGAIAEGYEATAELLLIHGADLNQQADCAIIMAAAADREDCKRLVKLLLDAGTNIEILCPNNMSPLDYAIAEYTLNAVSFLLECGAIIRDPVKFKKFLDSQKVQHTGQIDFCYGVLHEQEARALISQAHGRYINARKKDFSPAFCRLTGLTEHMEEDKINIKEIKISKMGIFKAKSLICGYLDDFEMGKEASRVMFGTSKNFT